MKLVKNITLFTAQNNFNIANFYLYTATTLESTTKLENVPVDEGTTRRGTNTPVHRPEKPAGSTLSSTSGLSLCEQLKRQAEIHSSTEDEA